MRRNRGVLGSILCLLLGIILGVVVTIGVEAVVVSHFYKNVKLKEINDKTGTEIFGSSTIDGEEINLAGMSLEDLVALLPELGNKTHNITLANIEELLPIIHMDNLFSDDMLNADKTALRLTVDGAELMEIPMEEIRTHALTELPKYIVDQIKTQVKFRIVENLGIDFSHLPFVTGTSANGTPVYSYILLGNGQIPEFYAKDLANVCYQTAEGTYLPATSDMLADRGTGTSVNLYYKTQGLNDIPFIDGVNALSSVLDTSTMTLAILDEKFALGLKDANGNYQSAILSEIDDITFANLSSELDGAVKNLTLAEAFGQADGVAFESRILESLRNVKISELDQQIGSIVLGDVIEITDGSSAILRALKDASVNNLEASINALTLSQMVTVPSDDSFFAKLMQVEEVQNATLSTLSTAISSVKITEMFPESHDEHGNLKGIWYFLLKDNANATVSDFGTVVDNAANNIATATIGELVEKGVISATIAPTSGLYYYPLQELIQDLANGDFIAIQNKIMTYTPAP